MKDFDVSRKAREEADRSFQIGGEKFVYRPAVAPEAILSWTEFSGATDKEEAALAAAKARLHALESLPPGTTPEENARQQGEIADMSAKVAEKAEELAAKSRSDGEWIEVIDETIVAIIEPGYADLWAKVRDPNLAHPISLGDLQELMEWLIEQVVSRPTGQPSGSSAQVGTTETSSTADSSSPVAQA